MIVCGWCPASRGDSDPTHGVLGSHPSPWISGLGRGDTIRRSSEIQKEGCTALDSCSSSF
eukprot:9486843-Alexandrium_andersonii.AAC.1